MCDEKETKMCANCKHEVPVANFIMHVAHCQRNLAVCPVCGEAVPRGHLKDHQKEQHTLIKCPDCNYKVQSSALKNHQETQCGKKHLRCEYCELELPRFEMNDHLTYCGTRTERCPTCNELVMFKYKQLHLDSNHTFLKLADEPGPVASWETNSTALTNAPIRQSPIKRTNDMPQVNSFVPANLNKLPEKIPIRPVSAQEPLHDMSQLNSTISAIVREKTGYKQPLSNKQTVITPTRITTPDISLNASSLRLMRFQEPSHFGNKLQRNDEVIAQREINNTVSSLSKIDQVDLSTSKQLNINSVNDVVSSSTSNQNTPKSLGAIQRQLPPRLRRMAPPPPLLPQPRQDVLSDRLWNNDKIKEITSENFVEMKTENISMKPKKPSFDMHLPIEQTVSSSESEEYQDVNLPCEFCHAMIPASNLVLHETGCRPDLARFNVNNIHSIGTRGRNNSPIEWDSSEAASVLNLNKNDNENEVQLPCEFCCELYPASKLLRHQALCDI